MVPQKTRIVSGPIISTLIFQRYDFSDTKQVSYLELDAVYNANFFISQRYTQGRGIGDIHEIIVFDTVLTPAQRMDVQYYLSKKWNLTTVVDSDGDITDAVEIARAVR